MYEVGLYTWNEIVLVACAAIGSIGDMASVDSLSVKLRDALHAEVQAGPWEPRDWDTMIWVHVDLERQAAYRRGIERMRERWGLTRPGQAPSALLDRTNRRADDESRLETLYRAIIGQAANPSQTAFVRAWEMCGFIAGDGFEWLFDQDLSPEELIAVFESVGFRDGGTFVRRAFGMVPSMLLGPSQADARRRHLESQFAPLRELLYEYLDAALPRFVPALTAFVQRHRADFEDLDAPTP
jgi:hypothetical protein